MPRLGKEEYPARDLAEILEAARSTVARGDDGVHASRELGNLDELKALRIVEEQEGRVVASALARQLAETKRPRRYIRALLVTMSRVPLYRLLLRDAMTREVATSKTQLAHTLLSARVATSSEIEAQIDVLWGRYREFIAEVIRAHSLVRGRRESALFDEPSEGTRRD